MYFAFWNTVCRVSCRVNNRLELVQSYNPLDKTLTLTKHKTPMVYLTDYLYFLKSLTRHSQIHHTQEDYNSPSKKHPHVNVSFRPCHSNLLLKNCDKNLSIPIFDHNRVLTCSNTVFTTSYFNFPLRCYKTPSDSLRRCIDEAIK